MFAKDVMSTDVAVVGPEATIVEAARIMLDRRVSGLPVVDGAGALIGMITQGDLMRRAEFGADKRPSWWLRLFTSDGTLAADYARAHGRFVREAMSRSVVAIEETASIARIAELLDHLSVKRLPVLRDGRLVGVVSRRDLLKALIAAPARQTAPTARADAEIAAAIRAAMARAAWIDQAQIVLVVEGGTARMSGRVSAEGQHQALRALVENMPGVTAVDDQVTVGPGPA